MVGVLVLHGGGPRPPWWGSSSTTVGVLVGCCGGGGAPRLQVASLQGKLNAAAHKKALLMQIEVTGVAHVVLEGGGAREGKGMALTNPN